jgi:hypothetical protein
VSTSSIIHAALSAALTIAGRAIDESWRNNPLRIMSPAEIRDILALKINAWSPSVAMKSRSRPAAQ